MLVYLHTARLSVWLDDAERLGGEAEALPRRDLRVIDQIGGYSPAELRAARLAVFHQGPETPTDVDLMGKAIAFAGDPFGDSGAAHTIDLYVPLRGDLRFLGRIRGDAVWVDTSRVWNRLFVIESRIGGRVVEHRFDGALSAYRETDPPSRRSRDHPPSEDQP